MPFINLDEIEKFAITPQHSDAYGELVTGSTIEVGRLFFAKGDGAEPHSHSQEQIIVILSGRVAVTFDGETRELGSGEGFHAPPFVPHGTRALEDCVMLSCKNVEDGVGHPL